MYCILLYYYYVIYVLLLYYYYCEIYNNRFITASPSVLIVISHLQLSYHKLKLMIILCTLRHAKAIIYSLEHYFSIVPFITKF